MNKSTIFTSMVMSGIDLPIGTICEVQSIITTNPEKHVARVMYLLDGNLYEGYVFLDDLLEMR